MKARHTFVATGLVALLALAGVTAAIAADPAGDPPPKIAFLANGIVPADALAAGPIAGQLGAPVFTTQPDTLSAPAAEGLDAANPELVIVLGGPVAIQDGVLAQVSSVTGLAIVADPDSRPDVGIVRAAGEDRFETAKIVAQLVGDYDPAYLGVDLKADDSDMLDGKDSTAFLSKAEKAADSDKLDGKDSTAFLADAPGSVTLDHLGQVPAVRVRGAAAVPNASDTTMSWSTEAFDSADMFDPGSPTVLTAPIDGIYLVRAGLRYTGDNATGDRGLYFSGLGANNALVQTPASLYLGSAPTALNVGTLANLSAGSTVSTIAFQDSGASRTPTSAYTFFEMVWVAPSSAAAMSLSSPTGADAGTAVGGAVSD